MSDSRQSQSNFFFRFSRLDRLGMLLSMLCLVHCLVLPFLILSLPILARYYLLHPYAHLVLAVLIVPLGLWTFVHGYRAHQNRIVLILGIPGLILVGLVPLILHRMSLIGPEPILVAFGSLLLVFAHWKNRSKCGPQCHVPH